MATVPGTHDPEACGCSPERRDVERVLRGCLSLLVCRACGRLARPIKGEDR